MSTHRESRPGMQRSDTTDCEVVVYHKGDDPVVFVGDKRHLFGGKRPVDPKGMVIGASTSSMLGQASGEFTVMVKPAQSDLFHRIVDDDWVDIVFKKHARQWHTMRGIVKEVRRSRAVAGATTETLTITGREWGHVFELTPIWFNRFSAENLAGAVSYKVFNTENIGGSVSKVVQSFLFAFLRELSSYGRANWEMPEDMPGIYGSKFLDNVGFDNLGWLDEPARIAVTPSFTQPSGMAWDLAQGWSDPMFCEMFTDLRVGYEFAPEVDGLGPEAPLGQTDMAVFLRDKPFPTIAQGLASAWFKLPLFVVPRFSLASDDVGKSGLERYNSFMVGPQMIQEMIGTDVIDLVAPLWHPEEILRHGLRRMDINTQYVAAEGKSLHLAESLRTRIRDWYCLNPYFLNGVLPLTHGRPDIHKGARVRIPGLRGSQDDETYYCEGTAHNWEYGKGLRTSLTVTRGWRGSDNSLLEALTKMVAGYKTPLPATAGA